MNENGSRASFAWAGYIAIYSVYLTTQMKPKDSFLESIKFRV